MRTMIALERSIPVQVFVQDMVFVRMLITVTVQVNMQEVIVHFLFATTWIVKMQRCVHHMEFVHLQRTVNVKMGMWELIVK